MLLPCVCVRDWQARQTRAELAAAQKSQAKLVLLIFMIQQEWSELQTGFKASDWSSMVTHCIGLQKMGRMEKMQTTGGKEWRCGFQNGELRHWW